MGAITRSVANGITTNGVVLKSIINNDSFDNVTALPSSLGDGITLISSQTASNSASLSFTSGLDSTYKAYKFLLVNIHARTDNVSFAFQGSTNGGSSYGIAITSTHFYSLHNEADSATALSYNGAVDLAQSTSFQEFQQNWGSDADQSGSGELTLFNPSSTTYVKHFISRVNNYHSADYSTDVYNAGYFNTTSAINAIQFKMLSGNMDGTIYLYGIK